MKASAVVLWLPKLPDHLGFLLTQDSQDYAAYIRQVCLCLIHSQCVRCKRDTGLTPGSTLGNLGFASPHGEHV